MTPTLALSAARRLRALSVLLLAATAAEANDLQGEGLGSTWKVTLPDPVQLDATGLQRGIQHQIDLLTTQLSRWNPKSTLSELNAAPDDTWHPLPPELFTALTYARSLAESTNGAYDPTVAPLVDVWGFGTQGRRYSPPSINEITAARSRVGWPKLVLDAAGHRVRRPIGTQIDLSSMTHGFAADQVANYLHGIGVTRYLIDVGSELRARGTSHDGHTWRVAIERPPSAYTNDTQPAGQPPLHVIALRDAGIATSGNYRYFFDYDGKRYSHRIDPRTGAPIANALAAVTVIAPECMHADALATALTVLGPNEGFDYAQRHDIAALFVLRNDQGGLDERVTPQFEPYLE